IRRQLQRRFVSPDQLIELTSKSLSYPVFARPETSDLLVFDQVFVERQYRCVGHVKTPKLILDCGANVGYSSAYFLSRHPECFVIAVEPDANNFAMLKKNLGHYDGRYKAIQAAIWPRAETLQFNKSFSESGQEWSRRVERVAADSPHLEYIKAVDIS